MMASGGLVVRAERETDGWTSAVAALLAALSLGRALQINNGHFRPEAIAMLTLACALALVAVASPRFSAIERHGPRIAFGVLAVGVTYEIVELVSRSPGMYLQLTRFRELLPFFGGVAVCGALAVAALLGERWKRVCVPLLLLGHFLLGVWMIHASPDPRIDVYVFQRDASAALLSGHDPYGMSHPYLGPDPRFYGPGMLVDGRLHIGFPYPPLSAFLCLPGHLFGDYRYSHLAAMTLAGGIMAFLWPGPLATGAAALFLFTPRGFFVLEQGWTEPLVVLALVATVACAGRFRRALPYGLGLFFAVKQYSVLAAPLVALLLPRPLRWRDAWGVAWRAVAVALVMTLPLALVDVPAFVHDVVVIQVWQPFRFDALSFLALFAGHGVQLPTALAFVALAALMALALLRVPRTPSGFALGVAVSFLSFFAFNKQAFCNYYYFVVGALCLAAAASRAGGERSASPAS
jgi:hypothetical protein